MDILNKKNEILEEIIKNIDKSDEVYIAISFITWNGFEYLLKESNLKKKKLSVITTTENFITDYPTLNYFLKNNIDAYLIDENRSFHSKFIVFKNDENINAMVGSLNLTKNSLFDKYESVSFVNGKEYEEQFSFLKKQGKKITRDIVEDYKIRFNSYEARYKDIVDDLKFKANLKPNKMQEPVLNELSNLRDEGENKALLWSATGTGKTYLAAFDIRNFKFNKLLFIVHNRTIIKSAKRDFENIHYSKTALELFTNNIRLSNDSEMIFTTEKTIKSILEKEKDFLNKFDYVVFDEAHKIGPNNIQGEIFELIKNKKDIFILAMTATPNRSDFPDFLIKSFKNIIGKIDTKKAIELELISTFNYYGVDVDVDFEKNDLNSLEMDLMMNKFLFQLDSNETWDGSKIKGIIFTKTIKEADEVSKRLNEGSRYKSYSIHSKSLDDSAAIGDYIDELQNENTELNFLVTVNKFNEGVDIPKINTIGMFRFTESNIIYTQQIGRGLRIDPKKEKILNVIDLVGNHSNSFERIAGINGSTTMNPREILERLQNNDLNKSNLINDFNISKKAREKILKSLGKLSFKKHFIEKINELSVYYKEEINLLNIEVKLNEKIQLISNNLRMKKTLNSGDKSWYVIAKEKSGFDTSLLNDYDNQIIELFSWMPITVSSPDEKREIINLLKNKKANLSNKWQSYFMGKNYFEKKSTISQLVRGNFEETFILNKKTLYFDDSKLSDSAKILLDEVLEYLEVNVNRNDKLSSDGWYSKVEIGFIAGYTATKTHGKFNRYKNDNSENFDLDETFLTNGVYGNSLYSNEVLENNKFIISEDSVNGFKNELKVHNFLGQTLFNKGRMVLYKYIGKPISVEWIDTKTRNHHITSKDNYYKEGKYNRYEIITETELNERDLRYLQFNY